MKWKTSEGIIIQSTIIQNFKWIVYNSENVCKCETQQHVKSTARRFLHVSNPMVKQIFDANVGFQRKSPQCTYVTSSIAGTSTCNRNMGTNHEGELGEGVEKWNYRHQARNL